MRPESTRRPFDAPAVRSRTAPGAPPRSGSTIGVLWPIAVITFLLLLLASMVMGASAANAQSAWFEIKGDDGASIANHRVPVELESQIESLPGVVVVGNPRGDVTLVEFYDLNCPFCRKAAGDVGALLQEDPELRLVLVPFPVLGIPSIQAARVELAVARIGSPKQFYAFHRKIYAGRGTIEGQRALAAAKELGLPLPQITKVADDDSTTDTMLAHVRLGDSLGLAATPAYVIKGIAVLGHPGRKALEGIIASVRRCDKVVC